MKTNYMEYKSTDLKELAKTLKVKNWWTLKKADLITEIEKAESKEEEEIKTIEKGLKKEDTQWKFPSKRTKKKQLEEILEKDLTTGDKAEGVEIEEDITDLVTLKELTIELGVKGTKARRILRNNNIERPYKRWEWSSVKHKAILKKVRDLLK
jgi:hypothetical protein